MPNRDAGLLLDNNMLIVAILHSDVNLFILLDI